MWPTPATRDHHAQGLSHNPASRSSSLATVIQRENAAQTWLTPTVQDSKHSGVNPGPNGKRDLLVNQVNWPTPAARDYKDFGPNVDYQKVAAKSKLAGVVMINQQDYPAQQSGSLNPDWVEWLMGVPIGWTDLPPSEMP